ncbi:MAG: GH3 auxin-responsive promoter family protein [Planctomycetota bacterium]
MKPLPLVANAVWAGSGVGRWARFRRALAHPVREQERLLADCLRANAVSAFGRRYGFASIGTMKEYRERVPLSRHADYREDLERVAAGEPGVLTAEPVRRLAWSSGSTDAAKLVPYTAGLERAFRRALAPWIVDLFGRAPSLAAGPAFWSVTPKVARDRLPEAKIPVGFEEDGDYLGGLGRRVVEAALAVPPSVAELAPDDARRRTALHLLLARELRVVSVWHPSFFTLLLDDIDARWDELLAELAERGAAGRRRARELAGIGPGEPARTWPGLALVSCWADAHAALGARTLSKRLPGVRVQPKGLISTEAFCSLPFAGRHPLAVRSHVFELLDGEGRPHGIDEARLGERYELVVSTSGGLYRYRTGDLVEVDGFVGRTPSIRFRGRADQVSDRCGEKLSDGFVAQVLDGLFTHYGARPRFALLAPEVEDGPPGYVLFLDAPPLPEDAEERLEQGLGENPHYALCASLRQLAPARIEYVEDGDARYLAACVERGRRLGDVKPAALSAEAGWSRRLRTARPARRGARPGLAYRP